MVTRVLRLQSCHWSAGQNAPTSGPASMRYLTSEAFTGREIAGGSLGEADRRVFAEEGGPVRPGGFLHGGGEHELVGADPAAPGSGGDAPFDAGGDAQGSGRAHALQV